MITLYGGNVSMSVLLVLCALLIVAGGVSLLAAVMGNPVRIGPLSVSGPEGALERALIGVVGAVCVAAVLPIVLMNRDSTDPPFRSANATATPEPSSTTVAPSPLANPSPTPEAGPSVAAATPGVPTVTSIAVGQDSGAGCVRTFTATVRISNGPVPVRYRIYVDGVVAGPANRQKTISGTGARTLDAIQVTASHSGDVRVRFDVLGPNPSILTGSAIWTAPAACNPAVPVTTTAQPTPTLSITGLSVTNLGTDLCTSVTVHATATLTVGSAPTGLDVSWGIDVGGQSGGSGSTHVDASAPLAGSAILVAVTPGQVVTVQVSANAPGAAPASASTDYPITCTDQPPPP